MRLFAVVPGYLPETSGGAEIMLRTLMQELQRVGHSVRIIVVPEVRGRLAPVSNYVIDDLHVECVRLNTLGELLAQVQPNLVISQLAATVPASQAAARYKIPTALIIHNDLQRSRHRLSATNPNLLVFNSNWLARTYSVPSSLSRIVVHPPVDCRNHKSTRGDHVTMINLTAAKGTEVFYSLARSEPGRRFLGVVSRYGDQDRRILPNVTFQEQTGDMRLAVWSRTRVLLMPSSYESYGLAALEACCSGIPVIAHPTPGLREALGGSALYCDRDQPEAWLNALRRLDDSQEYSKWSRCAQSRIHTLQTQSELDNWVRAIEGAALSAH